ncbi:uncharacterized protein LOC127278570 [Leptopilina boulardi]|uniref:uncharacterized protein LOC127278570 n=1 Tax=Leptopilina boulardi TaxID=63433 RepID=UPI0021F66CDE|nr:uncharacterized protein LOC127278570 [Leptopilina boulardi]
MILDPRFKYETFEMTEWGREMAAESLKKFEQIFKQIYTSPDLRYQPTEPNEAMDTNDKFNLFSLFEQKSYSESGWRHEISRYLKEPRADKNTDIAQWWKENQNVYPNLNRMARDFFSIQATSVPAERFFSKAGLTIRKHRNRVNHESARTCICLNSWTSCSLSSVIKEKFDRAEK